MHKILYHISTLIVRYQVFYLMIIVFLFNISVLSGQLYTLDATSNSQNIRSGHIKVEKHEGAAHQFGVNNQFFTKDGKPWFPLMGEFHYVRYPHEYWEEEIVKMKSAGLSIIATYVFWNAHENPKGTWNWTRDLDLRRFVELCQKHEMMVWLRIGPWSHGEQLHGGHPDWIQKMKGKRSNDSAYLEEAENLYHQIGIQTKGLFYKNGGPIIGVQLENEFASGHNEHISTLKQLAISNGIEPVYFTITANTVFKDNEYEFIPLQGGYPYRGWVKGGGVATKDFLYGNDQWILTDGLGKLYYDTTQYPKGLCEQGCGSQMTYKNRFVVEPHVIEAHLQNQLGRGMNLIGYYMFHGGTQMPGLKEPGYPESYDFQAPISEFGLLSPSYKYLKILHHFVNDFGSDLAMMQVIEPNHPVRDEYNIDDLRFVARLDGNSGFLFLGNTQVRVPMTDKKVRFKINLATEMLEFPRNEFLLKGQTTAILPFNMSLNAAILKYATAQPLSRLHNENEDVLFLMQQNEVPIELAFDANTIKKISADGWKKEAVNEVIYLTKDDHFEQPVNIIDHNGKITKIQILTRAQAENSWRIQIQGKESMVITKADLLTYQDQIELRQLDQPDFSMDIFPKPKIDFSPNGINIKIKDNGMFRNYSFHTKAVETKIQVEFKNSESVLLQLPKKLPANCSDFIVDIDYLGGGVTAKINNDFVTDHLFHGPTWKFGIKRYLENNKSKLVLFEIQPWSDQITGVSTKLVKEIKEIGSKFVSIKVSPQYKINIQTQ